MMRSQKSSFGRWMQNLLRGAFVSLCLMVGAAHAASYAYRNVDFSWQAPSASATSVTWSGACTGFPGGDDDYAVVNFPSGFTFQFAGASYSSVRIMSNGILSFGIETGIHRDYTPVALPAPASNITRSGCVNSVPANSLFVYWIDINTSPNVSSAPVKYELLGTAPNRQFIVTWQNVALYGDPGTRYSFQAILYENNTGLDGEFRYQYTTGSTTGLDATVGVQVASSDYTQYSYDQNFIDPVNGTAILWYPSNQYAPRIAEYRFDEVGWVGMPGEVSDTSGGLGGSVVGTGVTNIDGGKLCRGGSIARNTSNATVTGIASPLTPGRAGAVDFWFNSNSNWNSSDAMLFDASTASNRPFFLMKRSSGRLRFVVSDSVGTTLSAETGNIGYSSGTWHHVAVTWNIRAGTNLSVLEIYLDGMLVAQARGTTNGTLPSLGGFHFGDNRTSGITPINGTGNSANGVLDEIYLYNIPVSRPQIQADMNTTRLVCAALDHFRIIHGGSISNCGLPVAEITIEAHDLNHALVTLGGTTIQLSTSTGQGTWSNIPGGSVSVVNNLGGGVASYTFSNESSIRLGLSSPVNGPVNINVAAGSITERSGAGAACVPQDYTYGASCDADLRFDSCVDSFTCLESGTLMAAGSDLRTGRLYTKLSGVSFSVDVAALKADGTVETGYVSTPGNSLQLELVDASGGGGCASLPALNPAVGHSLSFSAANQGRRPSTSMTVGKAWRNLKCRLTDASQTPAKVSCSGDAFAVRPGEFSGFSTGAADADLANGANALATPTLKAGTDGFDLRFSSVAGYDGTPVIDAGGIEQHAGSIAAMVTINGSLGTADPATGVSVSTDLKYPEVGYFRFKANAIHDDDFAAVDKPVDCTDDFSNALVSGKYGCHIGHSVPSPWFGRFIPDHFTVLVSNDGSMRKMCGGSFTYTAQPMGYDQQPALTVTAVNGGLGITRNYTGTFARLAPSDVSITAPTEDATKLGADGVNKLSLSTALNTGTLTDNGDGTLTYTLSPDDRITHAKSSNARVAPFMADIRLPVAQIRDADGVSATGPLPTLKPTGAEIRFGRLLMDSAYGSERLPLSLPVRAEYWSGSAWRLNSMDSCTAYASPSLGCADPSASDGLTCASTNVSGGGILNLGAGAFSLSAPNAPGALDYTLTVSDWLKDDRNGDGSYAESPSARATFGIYGQRERMIYMREVWN
ncbi:MAG: DUF6701 domain-containing protein [Pseudomonadota bacterium]